MLSRRAVLFQLPTVLFSAFSCGVAVNEYYPLPKPYFRINQRVKVFYDLESCPDLVEAVGVIKGMMWQPENWRIQVGWVYDVHFFPDPILGDDSWREDIPESDIEAC